jgi:hypothetical protein
LPGKQFTALRDTGAEDRIQWHHAAIGDARRDQQNVQWRAPDSAFNCQSAAFERHPALIPADPVEISGKSHSVSSGIVITASHGEIATICLA